MSGSYKTLAGVVRGYSAGTHDLTTTRTVAPLTGDVWKYVIATNSNSEDYGVNLTAPVTSSITITSDGSATKAEIANAIAVAWNNNSTCSRYALAVSDGVDTVYFRSHRLDVVIAEDENAAKTTLTHPTVDAGAVRVPDRPRLLKLRGKITAATTFVPGTDAITFFLAADAAGEIPVTNELALTTTAGLTTPATKGGFSVNLDGIVEGDHADRVDGSLYVVAKCAQGTCTVKWLLDHETDFGSDA